MNRTVKKEKFKTKLPMIGIISLIAFLCVSPFFIKPEHPNHSNAEIVPGFDFQLSEPPYLWPINTQPTGITSHFGSRLNPFTKKLQQHRGIDIKAKLGTKIMSPSDATVLEVGYNKKDGHFIILQHDDVYKTSFCHLSKTAVETGIQVKAGEAIGEVGNSGMSTKPHLHYEVMKNGLHVDPIDYLKT